MLTIVMTPGEAGPLVPLLDSLPRWRQAVRLRMAERPDAEDGATLVIDAEGVRPALPFGDAVPPYVLPTLPLSAESLDFYLALSEADAPTDEARVQLPDDIAHLTALVRGSMSHGRVSEGTSWRELHDRAVLHHYAAIALADPDQAVSCYERAIAAAPSPAAFALTAWQYATLLLDLDRPGAAAGVLLRVDDRAIGEAARMAIRSVRLPAVLQGGTEPPSPAQLEALREDALALQRWYDERGEPLRAALLRLDEAQLLQQLGRFREAVTTVDAASRTLEEAGEAELFAAAALRRAEVQHAWAQAGARDQFAKAMESFQEALTVFSKESAPHVFGTIHHQLAVLYAEMPTDPQKRPILLALSGQSFEEALGIFSAERHPLHHAEIRANYGNALLRCPDSHLRDPAQRAVDELRRALDIYRAHDVEPPQVLVQLNLLEALWQLGWNAESESGARSRLEELEATWSSLESLTVPDALRDDVQRWRAKLDAAHAAG
ncbi:MAG: hypothetical protein MUF21_02875 [Gemmatimonadaceae bacterium]|jgi:tetratricopeptide (TPR) repeat protein|nr:hypothetical protein [Gemmatimonadaceae bacterium]